MILAIEIDDTQKEIFLNFCNEHNGKVLDKIDTEDVLWSKSHSIENEEYLSEADSKSVLENLKEDLTRNPS